MFGRCFLPRACLWCTCDWSICGTWVYPECPLRCRLPSLSLSSCLRPSPPSPSCSVVQLKRRPRESKSFASRKTQHTATGFERFDFLQEKRETCENPSAAKASSSSLLSEQFLHVPVLCWHKFYKEGQFAKKKSLFNLSGSSLMLALEGVFLLWCKDKGLWCLHWFGFTGSLITVCSLAGNASCVANLKGLSSCNTTKSESCTQVELVIEVAKRGGEKQRVQKVISKTK